MNSLFYCALHRTWNAPSFCLSFTYISSSDQWMQSFPSLIKYAYLIWCLVHISGGSGWVAAMGVNLLTRRRGSSFSCQNEIFLPICFTSEQSYRKHTEKGADIWNSEERWLDDHCWKGSSDTVMFLSPQTFRGREWQSTNTSLLYFQLSVLEFFFSIFISISGVVGVA